MRASIGVGACVDLRGGAVSCRHVVITLRVVPDRRRNFWSVFTIHHVLAEMKSEPAYYKAILHRDPQCENVFMLYDTWESHDDVVNEQLKRPYRRAWHDALPRMLEGEREISVWRQ